MDKRRFYLSAYGMGRPVSFGAITPKVTNLLERLREIHPDFKYWETLGETRYEQLDAGWIDLNRHLTRMARPRVDDRIWCTDLDVNFDVTANTTSRYGFAFNFYTSEPVGGPPDGQNYARPDHVAIRMHGGGDSFSIEFWFAYARPDFLESGLMRKIVNAVLEVWEPLYVEVGSPALRERYLAGAASRSKLNAGWINYFRHPLLAACLPTGLPGQVEVFNEGAMLFTLTPSAPDPDNAEDVEKACALQRFFDQLHIDHVYVLGRWPYDKADDDYCEQVTGTPRDRKYAVAFYAFDGYDARRKVLLHARLFRDSTGQILHRVYQENADRREELSFVVLARHQIAAVEYAGASTAIEWHVGEESNARDLATLLNGLAGIPVEKLRVVYTPYKR